jgi:tRNA 2-selenouridine synthase
MTNAPLIVLEMNRELRVKRLVEDYGKYSNDELCLCLDKISRRLGGFNTNQAKRALEEGKPEITAEIVLDYYDKTYDFSLSRRWKNKIFYCNSSAYDPEQNALLISSIALQNKLVTRHNEQ